MALVGYNKDTIRQALTATDTVIISGLSGAATRAICQPLDVIKIRYQLKAFKDEVTPMTTAVAEIYRTGGGVSAFWKGHMPAQYLSIVYGIGQFGAFEAFTKFIATRTGEPAKSRPVLHFCVGSLAGVVANVISFPFDVIRTRLVAQNDLFYRGTHNAVSQMLKNEGPRAFFKGLLPTIIAIAPYSGFQFGFYSVFTDLFRKFVITEVSVKNEKVERITFLGSALCGVFSGLCSKVIIYPLDTVKKRLQVQGFKGYSGISCYSGFIECLTMIMRNEGLRGFYRGLTPGLIKAMATTGVNFCFYEYISFTVASYRKTHS